MAWRLGRVALPPFVQNQFRSEGNRYAAQLSPIRPNYWQDTAARGCTRPRGSLKRPPMLRSV